MRIAICVIVASCTAVDAFAFGTSPHHALRRHSSSSSSTPAVMIAEEDRRPPVELLALNVNSLSEEQVANIHEVADMLFNLVDRNGDEVISKEELGAHLLLARYSEEAIEALFKLMDVNSDGEVSRAELRDAYVKHPSLRGAPAMGSLSKSKRAAVFDEADEQFTALDLDGNGRLSLSELQTHFAGREGPSYSADAVAKIFKTLGGGGDGSVEEVTRSEFRGAYVRYRAMRLAIGHPAIDVRGNPITA